MKNKDNNISVSVIKHYNINILSDKVDSSDEEEKEVKEINTAKALRCAKLLKL